MPKWHINFPPIDDFSSGADRKRPSHLLTRPGPHPPVSGYSIKTSPANKRFCADPPAPQYQLVPAEAWGAAVTRTPSSTRNTGHPVIALEAYPIPGAGERLGVAAAHITFPFRGLFPEALAAHKKPPQQPLPKLHFCRELAELAWPTRFRTEVGPAADGPVAGDSFGAALDDPPICLSRPRPTPAAGSRRTVKLVTRLGHAGTEYVPPPPGFSKFPTGFVEDLAGPGR